MIHFYKDLTDQDRDFIDFCLANLNSNYLDTTSEECTDQQYKLAEFLEDILIKISDRNDGLLLDVIKDVFSINTEKFFNK